MDRMRLWSAAIIIGAVLIVGFVLSVPRVRDLGGKPAMVATASSTPMVSIHDVFKKGTHTITVKIPLSDACTSITGEADVIPGDGSSTPDTIGLVFDMPTDTGICLEEPSTTTLSYTAIASANAIFTASINGNDASTTQY